ncbi:hypothetical protein PENTCL1PPCAC_18355 [Pristionchus entomophagus]|uniref:TraB domain-containing protein n=1 Tax=Pristionchus entomophagus TaxID=358040 RepID=A0AAV5TPJ9_9BILA|nr:hypothetical protein PENTCL1PPCAC_18355 [Pristionchus entomophagus]
MDSGDAKSEHFDEEKNELTEQDVIDMKNLSVNGSHSVVSLADSTSNFGEHVGDEIQMEDIEEVNVRQVEEEIDQARIYGGYMFDRRRAEDGGQLPETVSVLHWPFPIPACPEGENPQEWEAVYSGAEVYLVGTAHFSKNSQEDVKKVIERVQPDVVMVELCPSRISVLSLDEETLLREAQELTTTKMMQLMKRGGPLHGVMYTLLISMSAHVTRQLGMAPGGEFRMAYRTANQIPLCQFVLGDRPIEVTIGRALGNLSMWQKAKFFFHLLTSHNMEISEEDVEKCKKKDYLEQLLEEMAGEFPGLSEIFVTERDKYMTNALQALLMNHTHRKRAAWQHTDGVKWQPLKVVGVVGIGHQPGIVAHWGEQIDISELIRIPPPTRTQTIVKSAVRWSLYGLAAYGLFRTGRVVLRRLGRL